MNVARTPCMEWLGLWKTNTNRGRKFKFSPGQGDDPGGVDPIESVTHAGVVITFLDLKHADHDSVSVAHSSALKPLSQEVQPLPLWDKACFYACRDHFYDHYLVYVYVRFLVRRIYDASHQQTRRSTHARRQGPHRRNSTWVSRGKDMGIERKSTVLRLVQLTQ